MNQDERLALAAKVTTEFYGRVKYKVGRAAFNRIDLEEMKQEASLYVLQCYAEPRMGEPDYLTRQVVNHLRRWLRRELRIAVNEIDLNLYEDFNEDGNSSAVNLLADPRPLTDPSDRAEMNEVLSAVDRLPPKQHAVIAGTLNSETHYSMARTLGITRRAVTDRVHSGINSLRLSLGVA